MEGKIISDFDVKLKWDKYPGAVEYSVWISRSPDGTKPLITTTVENPEYVLNEGKILAGRLFYQISAKLEDDSFVSSPIESFSFSFLPPVPVTPQGNSLISQSSLSSNKNQLTNWFGSRKNYRWFI